VKRYRTVCALGFVVQFLHTPYLYILGLVCDVDVNRLG
jgi:hypothetical protein